MGEVCNMDYQEIYNQEVKIYNDIARKYDELSEEDIAGAYELMKESIQAYNRWSQIKYDIKKELRRGEAAATKERLEEICRYLKEIHTSSRMIWAKSKETLRTVYEG